MHKHQHVLGNLGSFVLADVDHTLNMTSENNFWKLQLISHWITIVQVVVVFIVTPVSGSSKPPGKTRWSVTGALLPSQGLPKGHLIGAATNLRFKTLEKQAVKWISKKFARSCLVQLTKSD